MIPNYQIPEAHCQHTWHLWMQQKRHPSNKPRYPGWILQVKISLPDDTISCHSPRPDEYSPRARHCCTAKCSELGHRTTVLAKLQRCYYIAQNLESIMFGYKSVLQHSMVSSGEHCLASLSLNPLTCRMDLMITPHSCDLIFIKFHHSGCHTVCFQFFRSNSRRIETEILPLSITLTTLWWKKIISLNFNFLTFS